MGISRYALLCCGLLAGCGHSESFVPADNASTNPFLDSEPLRLTYNVGTDAWASWSPDGTMIYYSAQDSLTSDKDRCIARIPADGGSRATWQCALTQTPDDTTNALEQPATNGTQLAFEHWYLGVVQHSPYYHGIWLAADQPRALPRRVLDFPYVSPLGVLHNGALYLQWLRPGTLLYLGADEGCCRKDTLRFGEQVVLLDVSGSAAVQTFVPNTTRASSVFASRDGENIYYTFYGDSKVYRQRLADGDVLVIHDFGPGRIARDAQVVGNRLVAIVDGLPNLKDLPPFFNIHIDYGGLIAVVDLTTGQESQLPANQKLYKRPVLSPDGTRFVAEGFPMQVFGGDTVVSKWADLWLFEE